MPTIRERNGRHQAQVRIKRKGVIVYEATETFDTPGQAYLWGYGVEEKFKAGKIDKSPSAMTVGEVVQAHSAALVDAEKDIRGLSNSMKQLIESKLGRTPIVRVESGDVVAWGKAYGDTRAPATVLHALMTLRTCYSTARTELGIPVDVAVVADAVNHLNRLGISGKSVERDRRVTDAEIDKICKFHEGLMGTTIPLRIAMTLAVAIPRRGGELFGKMRWEHYDGETIKLFDTKDPKKIRNEIVPVPPKAKAIIAKIPRAKAGFICPWDRKSISSAIYKACRMLEIEDLHLHDLRHEGVSRLFEAGLDIPRVAMISGHQSWATLKRYTHLKPADVVARLVEEVVLDPEK
jgi:integrase